ncbi:MAG: quinolinate synthase NadA [Firmicutes bacterium]|nr:quinolinate synthase NadA [Bacillota bacterium]
MAIHVVKRCPGASVAKQGLENDPVSARIEAIRQQLGDELLILGHHYQQDNVIRYADLRGDSFLLARQATENHRAKYILFLGVMFMAETADIVTSPGQAVLLPAPQAGCMMANMATGRQVRECWEVIESNFHQQFIPVTYVNSSAEIKAFCGEKGGLTCTSSSCEKAFRWVMEQGKKVFFLPDQNLGRNTGVKVGIGLDAMAVWDRSKQQLTGCIDPSLILWDGYCPIHEQFTVSHIQQLRQEYPDIQLIVHPECPHATVTEANASGSTEMIIQHLQASSPGSRWGIGTEINLVKRLAREHSDKEILSLDERIGPCPDMMKITPEDILWCLESLLQGEIRNQISVRSEVAGWARIALRRMLDAGC